MSQHFPFTGTGDMGERIRSHDWQQAGFGDPAEWSPALVSSLGICLHSTIPTAIYWGEDHRLLYNDAWVPIAGERHPWSLGKPAHEVWSDIWHIISPQLQDVRMQRRGFATHDEPLPMARAGHTEESYWDYSFTPITEPGGQVVGVFNQGHETTERVHALRHDALREALGEGLNQPRTTREILHTALGLTGEALGAARAGFAEVDAPHGLVRIEHCWTDGSIAPMTGAHRLDEFGADFLAEFHAGRTYLIADARTDARLSPEARAGFLAAGINAAMVVPLMPDDRGAAALFLHVRPPRLWSLHQRALADSAARLIWQAVTRSRAETALRDSAERHRLIFEQTDAILFSADLNGHLTACNPSAARAFGGPIADLAARPLAELINAAGYAALGAALRGAAAPGATATTDVNVMRAGELRHWELTATRAIDRDGAATGFHAVARDVSAERAVAARQRRLINELNHRVKNMLALVQGLALQTFREGQATGPARAAFQDRLGALAAAHDLLTRNHWGGATLPALAAVAARRFAARIDIAGPALLIPPKPAISLALALHELGNNALRHGALSAPDGRIALGWKAEDGRLRLRWEEHGGPAAIAPAVRGFGLRMIERVLAADFGGTAALEFGPGGFVFAIDAPLPQIDPAAME